MVILPGLALMSAGAFTTASIAILVPAPQRISAVGEPRKRPHCLMCLAYGED